MKNPLVAIFALALLLVAGSFIYSKNVSSSYNEGVDVSVENVTGNKDAAVVLVEYGDFECPACALIHPVLAEIMEEHGDKIRLEFKHFPLPMHSMAVPAAKAAEAAGQQGKFFAFHDILFERQDEWVKNANPKAVFESYAKELDLDVEKFNRQMKASLLSNRIKDDQNHGKSLSVSATPTFFLNGEKMTIKTYEDFKEQIEQAVNSKVDFPSLEFSTTTASEE